MKWIKFDPDAWLSGTRELSFEEKGIYIDFIALLYARDGNVPQDDALIARLLQCNPRTWRKVRPKLEAKGKIRKFGSNWTANRVELELNWARIRTEFSANKSKNTENSTAIAPSRGRARLTTPRSKEEENTQRRTEENPSEFEQFWQAYPRRAGPNAKFPAQNAFVAAVADGADPQAIIVGARAYAADPTTEAGTRWVKKAVIWLREHGWEDYAARAAELAAQAQRRAERDAEDERRAKVYWLNQEKQQNGEA